MRRVRATIDTWYDSACMPFAQFHYPFEGVEEFRAQFPPSFICEGIDQTRGWFYTSLAVSTLLFDDIPFQTAVCVGHVQDRNGHKMSKSRGNAVDPWDVLERHGADAFRWYYLASQQPWAGYRFSREAVAEAVKQVLLPLWEIYRFYVLYANIERFDARAAAAAPPPSRRCEMDRWALSRLQTVVREMRAKIDDFDAHGATHLALDWLDELSNWYVRLSRPRFWDSATAAPALATLRECLLTTVKLLAPALPFAAEELYENLVGGVTGTFRAEPRSVHLCDYPQPEEALVDARLERDMAFARETVELGRYARDVARVKVRQPLRRAIVCAASRAERDAVERMRELICRELNVKQLEVVGDELVLERPLVLPNLQKLGPRCGRDMGFIVSSLRTRDGDEALRALREHGVLTVRVGDPGDLHDPPRTYALAENDLDGQKSAARGAGAVRQRAAARPRRRGRHAARRRAAARGLGARDRARGAGAAQSGGRRRDRPDRAAARRQRGAARRGARARALPGGRDARPGRRLRRRRGRRAPRSTASR